MRTLGYKGPGQASPTLGDALTRATDLSKVRCLGCDTHQTVALDIVRRPKATPIHELERYMRCRDCSGVRGYPYQRSQLVALRSDEDLGERSTIDVVAGRTLTMKMIAEYLENALKFERLAAEEQNPELKTQLEKQALAQWPPCDGRKRDDLGRHAEISRGTNVRSARGQVRVRLIVPPLPYRHAAPVI
jgi:hypothetical protein